jgi:leucyl-tRNA synthetase
VVAEAMKDPKIQKFTDGMEIFKIILVKNKLVNLIVKPKK